MQPDLPLVTGSHFTAVPRNPVIARTLKTIARPLKTIARPLRALAILLTLVLSITSTATAKGPKGTGGKPFNKIVDVDAVSITISIGSDGNSHEKYSIIDATKVTLNGAPANARDLRSGMVAHIELSADGKTAQVVTAKDPPAHPERRRVG